MQEPEVDYRERREPWTACVAASGPPIVHDALADLIRVSVCDVSSIGRTVIHGGASSKVWILGFHSVSAIGASVTFRKVGYSLPIRQLPGCLFSQLLNLNELTLAL